MGKNTDLTIEKFSPKNTKSVSFVDFFSDSIKYLKYRDILDTELSKNGTETKDYFLTKPIHVENTIHFNFYHRTAFNYSAETIGNPGGNCRTIIINSENLKVVSNLFWK